MEVVAAGILFLSVSHQRLDSLQTFYSPVQCNEHFTVDRWTAVMSEQYTGTIIAWELYWPCTQRELMTPRNVHNKGFLSRNADVCPFI